MQPYLRTAEKILHRNEVDVFVFDGNLFCDSYANDTVFSKVLKQGNTIDELCDEFVLISAANEEANPLVLNSIKREGEKIKITFKDYSSCYLNDSDELYGAIWTRKGLIYVAKILNDTGVIYLLKEEIVHQESNNGEIKHE